MMRGRTLKPAPFGITPSIVRRVVELAETPAKGIVLVPMVPIKLVDEVKGSISKSFAELSARTDGLEEPARVAPVPAAPSAPAEFPNLGRPDNREKIALPAPRERMEPVHAPARKVALPMLSADVRRAQISAATAFLKRRGILVTPCDRDAQIRKYRVTGKTESKFHEEVIEIATSYGFEGGHAQG